MVDQVRNSPEPQAGDWSPGNPAPEYDGYYMLFTLRNGARFSFEVDNVEHTYDLNTSEEVIDITNKDGAIIAQFRAEEVVAIVRTKDRL